MASNGVKRKAQELCEEDLYSDDEDDYEEFSDDEDYGSDEYESDYTENFHSTTRKNTAKESAIAVPYSFPGVILDYDSIPFAIMNDAALQIRTWNQQSKRNRENSGEDPPIVRAAASGNRNLLLALLKLGCSIESALTIEYEEPKFHYTKTYTRKQDTPLIAVIRRGNFAMFEYLLEIGANPGPLYQQDRSVDMDDPPPLYVAMQLKNQSMIAHLQKQIFLRTKKFVEEVFEAECREPLPLFTLASLVVMRPHPKISIKDLNSLPDIVADAAESAVEATRGRKSTSYGFGHALLQLAKQYEEGIGTDVDKNECALWYARHLNDQLLYNLQNTMPPFYCSESEFDRVFNKIKTFADEDRCSNALSALPHLDTLYQQFVRKRNAFKLELEARKTRENEAFQKAYEAEMELYKAQLAEYNVQRQAEIRRCLAANRGKRAGSVSCREGQKWGHDFDKCPFDHQTDLPPRCRWISTLPSRLQSSSGCKLGNACWFNHLSVTKPTEPVLRRS